MIKEAWEKIDKNKFTDLITQILTPEQIYDIIVPSFTPADIRRNLVDENMKNTLRYTGKKDDSFFQFNGVRWVVEKSKKLVHDFSEVIKNKLNF